MPAAAIGIAGSSTAPAACPVTANHGSRRLFSCAEATRDVTFGTSKMRWNCVGFARVESKILPSDQAAERRSGCGAKPAASDSDRVSIALTCPAR